MVPFQNSERKSKGILKSNPDFQEPEKRNGSQSGERNFHARLGSGQLPRLPLNLRRWRNRGQNNIWKAFLIENQGSRLHRFYDSFRHGWPKRNLKEATGMALKRIACHWLFRFLFLVRFRMGTTGIGALGQIPW